MTRHNPDLVTLFKFIYILNLWNRRQKFFLILIYETWNCVHFLNF